MADRGRLTIICGLPGSGKTSLAIRLAASQQAVRMAPDEWMAILGYDIWDRQARARVEALQWALIQDLLSVGVHVIIEWGTWGRSERDLLREGARRLGASVDLRVLDVPLELLWERVRTRRLEEESGSRPMTYEDLVEARDAFQVPTEAERALYDPPYDE